MAAACQLRFSPIPNLPTARHHHLPQSILFPSSPSLSLPSPKPDTFPLVLRALNPNLSNPIHSPGFDNNNNNNNDGSGSGSGGNTGGGGGGGGGSGDEPQPSGNGPTGPLSLFLSGWRARVAADPQFPFKVLMEELVGVSACILGDMASRPNFGLNELDLVFSTLVVGSILNFVLMYLLAPTSTVAAAAASSSLPSYIFEPGAYSLSSRFATLINKGATFAAVGFAAGLVGTTISNGLMKLKKKMDPEFEPPNKPPPTLLNAMTWATHMGVSSNLRYQTLNGMEYVMGNVLPPAGFKVSVVALRCLNNVLGGMSFVLLARLTGSQKVEEKKAEEGEERLILEATSVGRGSGEDGQASD